MSSFELYAVFSSQMAERELETLKKKKAHLDELLNRGTISKFTYDYILKDLEKSIAEAESKQKVLIDAMTAKLQELEERKKELEMALAQLELKHIAGEIASPFFDQESKLLTSAIENTIRELTNIRRSLISVIPEDYAVEGEDKPEEEISESAPVETETTEAVEEKSVETVTSETDVETVEETVFEESTPTEEVDIVTETAEETVPSEDVETLDFSEAGEESLY